MVLLTATLFAKFDTACLTHRITQLVIYLLQGTILDVGREQLCQVEYDCGGKEWLALGQQHIRVLGPRASSAGCTLAVKVCSPVITLVAHR